MLSQKNFILALLLILGVFFARYGYFEDAQIRADNFASFLSQLEPRSTISTSNLQIQGLKALPDLNIYSPLEHVIRGTTVIVNLPSASDSIMPDTVEVIYSGKSFKKRVKKIIIDPKFPGLAAIKIQFPFPPLGDGTMRIKARTVSGLELDSGIHYTLFDRSPPQVTLNGENLEVKDNLGIREVLVKKLAADIRNPSLKTLNTITGSERTKIITPLKTETKSRTFKVNLAYESLDEVLISVTDKSGQVTDLALGKKSLAKFNEELAASFKKSHNLKPPKSLTSVSSAPANEITSQAVLPQKIIKLIIPYLPASLALILYSQYSLPFGISPSQLLDMPDIAANEAKSAIEHGVNILNELLGNQGAEPLNIAVADPILVPLDENDLYPTNPDSPFMLAQGNPGLDGIGGPMGWILPRFPGSILDVLDLEDWVILMLLKHKSGANYSRRLCY